MARNMKIFRANHFGWPVALAIAALTACSTDTGPAPPSQQNAAPGPAAPPKAAGSGASMAGASTAGPSTAGMSREMAAQLRQIMEASYLKGQWPNSLAILPAPPAKGSAAQARDDASAKAAQAMRGSPRWKQAT